MRDKKRIRKFCDELATLWENNAPDWRFGQLMYNIFDEMSASGRDPFFPEEDEMMEILREFLEKK